MLEAKLEDAENRSRWSTLHIRDFPESFVDMDAIMFSLFQELAPDILTEHLEIEWVHRALTCKRELGFPMDVVAKLLYLRSEESLLAAARDKQVWLSRATHTNCSPTCLQAPSWSAAPWNRAWKSWRDAQVSYRWGLLFALMFSYKQKQYTWLIPSKCA